MFNFEEFMYNTESRAKMALFIFFIIFIIGLSTSIYGFIFYNSIEFGSFLMLSFGSIMLIKFDYEERKRQKKSNTTVKED